jgi:hypothetical protein
VGAGLVKGDELLRSFGENGQLPMQVLRYGFYMLWIEACW